MNWYDNQPLIDDETKADILYRVTHIDEELAKATPSEEALAAEIAAWDASIQREKAELKRQDKILAKEESAALEKLEHEKLMQKDKLKSELASLQKDLEQCEAELSNLGFFSFSKKKISKQTIAITNASIESVKSQLDAIDEDYEHQVLLQKDSFLKQKEALSQKLAQGAGIHPHQKQMVWNHIRKNWPTVLENKAAEPGSLVRIKAAQLELQCYTLIILEMLVHKQTVLAIAEIMNFLVEFNYNSLPNFIGTELMYDGCISTQRISAELRKLVECGIIERTEDRRFAYFAIKNA